MTSLVVASKIGHGDPVCHVSPVLPPTTQAVYSSYLSDAHGIVTKGVERPQGDPAAREAGMGSLSIKSQPLWFLPSFRVPICKMGPFQPSLGGSFSSFSYLQIVFAAVL